MWHNYSFDRAVLWNHEIDVRGFGGDTMHMARLWDSNRQVHSPAATLLHSEGKLHTQTASYAAGHRAHVGTLLLV